MKRKIFQNDLIYNYCLIFFRGETIPVQVVDSIETVGLEPTSDAGESKKVRDYFFN